MSAKTNTIDPFVEKAKDEVRKFYARNPQILDSHGILHVMDVYRHAEKAVASSDPELAAEESREVLIAALLHDADDHKYFPDQKAGECKNARQIMFEVGLRDDAIERVVYMIGLVSCSKNGNNVPDYILDTGKFYLLIPRWSDRLEAVGVRGVVRSYQYSKEVGGLLSSPSSPRAQSEEEVWALATPDRFAEYQSSGGKSADMMSHYYDKLLQVSRPPTDIVRNAYLEQTASDSSGPLVEVCIRFGKTGLVDEEYIQSLAMTI